MTDYAALIHAARGRKVVVAGDVMLDRYWIGSADRLSPEAPVPVVMVHAKRLVLGGAANVAANAAALGADVTLVGAIGDDEAGAMLSTLVEASGITNRLVESPRPTTVKTRVVAQGQQITRIDEETQDELREDYHRTFEHALLRAVHTAETVVLQDYDKGALSAATVRIVLDVAKSWKIPTIVDPKHRDFVMYRGASLLKPNRQEFARAFDEHVYPELLRRAAEAGTAPQARPEDLLAQVMCARAIWDVAGVLVTLGDAGMVVAYRTSNREKSDGTMILEARHVPVADISGAGDTVSGWIGGLVAGGAPILDAIHIANIAASLQVTKAGTAVVSAAEVLAVLEQ